MPLLITGRLVIATHNAGKLREMRELLAPYGVDTCSAGELGLAEPDETGATFAENAGIKASSACQATDLASFADDSGLCIDALDGAPGVHSARYAKDSGGFVAAMRRLRVQLEEGGAQAPYRGHFVSALALARPGHPVLCIEDRVEGRLQFPPRGEIGFGYDPIFRPDGHARTFGEMSSEEKHGLPADGSRALSHRARAFQRFARIALMPEVEDDSSSTP